MTNFKIGYSINSTTTTTTNHPGVVESVRGRSGGVAESVQGRGGEVFLPRQRERKHRTGNIRYDDDGDDDVYV